MILYVAIGLGLVISLVFSEVLGLAAGGLVVPGYIALYLNEYTRIIATILASLATYAVIRTLSKFILLYGRRTLVFCVLTGFVFGFLTRYLLVFNSVMNIGLDPALVQSVGYIIPGLIAYWMLRQGVAETLCTMIIAAFIVRLILVAAHRGKILEYALG